LDKETAIMIHPSLNLELSTNVPQAQRRKSVSSRAFCLIGLLSVLACNGSIDNNEQRSSLVPNGSSGNTGAASNGAAPGTRAPVTSAGGGEQGTDNIVGLDDGESSTGSTSRGGSRRRAADRDRDDEDEDVDAGVDELLDDAGVLEDAGVIDGGVLEDGGLAADAAP
jgi:hypothetical protein